MANLPAGTQTLFIEASSDGHRGVVFVLVSPRSEHQSQFLFHPSVRIRVVGNSFQCVDHMSIGKSAFGVVSRVRSEGDAQIAYFEISVRNSLPTPSEAVVIRRVLECKELLTSRATYHQGSVLLVRISVLEFLSKSARCLCRTAIRATERSTLVLYRQEHTQTPAG